MPRRLTRKDKSRSSAAEPEGGTGDADVDPGTVQSFHHICFQQPDNDRGAYGSQPFRSPSVRASASALPPGRRLPRQAEGRSHHVSLRAQYGRSTTGSIRYQLLFTNSPTSDVNRNGCYGDVVVGVGCDGSRVDRPQTSGLMLSKTEATAEQSQPLLPVRVVAEIIDARG